MDANLTTAIVTAGSTALVAIVAILSNNKRLDDMNARLASHDARFNSIDTRFTSLHAKLDHIEQMLANYCIDVARIKERLDIK